MVPDALDDLTPEEHHRVYRMMRLNVVMYADESLRYEGRVGLLDTQGMISMNVDRRHREPGDAN